MTHLHVDQLGTPDLTATQRRALRALHNAGGALTLSRNTNAAAGIIGGATARRLAAHHLVTINTDPDDRHRRAHLTPAGRDIAAHLGVGQHLQRGT